MAVFADLVSLCVFDRFAGFLAVPLDQSVPIKVGDAAVSPTPRFAKNFFSGDRISGLSFDERFFRTECSAFVDL